jgi:hypothetical protein
VRVLCQRDPDLGWIVHEPVVRQSRTDPVVNAVRGAEVGPGTRLLRPDTLAAVRTHCQHIIRILSSQPGGDLLVEFGADLVIDDQGAPHVIEVNSRPRGRLEVLAGQDPTRFGPAHLDACARPLRFLAAQKG